MALPQFLLLPGAKRMTVTQVTGPVHIIFLDFMHLRWAMLAVLCAPAAQHPEESGARAAEH
jgi:hypothetical protein